ncbi:MAG: dimethylaniline monooxygenase [Bryobacterales bacterium]|nr:dimethylaniline monooxygenase [Bryobacterales bacterium]
MGNAVGHLPAVPSNSISVESELRLRASSRNYTSHPTAAIIGAGPYGVSLAAHLQAAGVDFRIFGQPMHRWRFQMPKGMFLKSEGCASNLADPAGRYMLSHYCAENGLPYGEWGAPVSRETFAQYALSFQRNFVPNVEQVMVAGVYALREGFELGLANGATVRASKVIVATGMDHAAYTPHVLSRLPSELLSHTADHHDLSRFKGKEVSVIGGGQSAIETAVLLAEEGASVRLLVRKPALVWNSTPKMVRRPFYQRLRHPLSNLGVGAELWIYCAIPMLFRHLPQQIRHQRVATVLGPAGAWWLRDRAAGRLQILLGHTVSRAEAKSGRAVLQVSEGEGPIVEMATDHVIAATGYRFSLAHLPFLSHGIKSQLRAEQQHPVLSSDFESSVPGLYFTGLASAKCFGPAMRFLDGADYTARRVTRRLATRRQSFARLALQSVRTRCKEF